MENEYRMHNDCLQKFNNDLYADIFTTENITSKKKCITYGAEKEKYYGYFLEKGKEQYFALAEHIEQLPFKALKTIETDYRGEVFSIILRINPITIPAKKDMSFRNLIDSLPAFQHTHPLHFTLYKLVAATAYMDRINARVSTDAGFGKDSVANIIAQLVDSTVNLYGATFAKLEYVLTNKQIILNELGNLKGDDKINMQEFLLATGAYFNSYTKRSRKTSTTQEHYDISNLSLMIFYNLPSYYIGKAQEYFDQMFTPAVVNRFIPFVFQGRISTSFEKLIDVNKIVEEGQQEYRNIIATLNYYRENRLSDIRFKIDESVITFDKTLMRYDRTFRTILKYVAEYANDQEEFDMMSKELYNCYKTYETLLVVEKERSELK